MGIYPKEITEYLVIERMVWACWEYKWFCIGTDYQWVLVLAFSVNSNTMVVYDYMLQYYPASIVAPTEFQIPSQPDSDWILMWYCSEIIVLIMFWSVYLLVEIWRVINFQYPRLLYHGKSWILKEHHLLRQFLVPLWIKFTEWVIFWEVVLQIIFISGIAGFVWTMLDLKPRWHVLSTIGWLLG